MCGLRTLEVAVPKPQFLNMICAFLRVVQHAEKLHGSLGRQLLPHFVLTKACLKTQPLRWGLREQKKTVQPRTVLGFTQKTFCTQGPDPRKAEEDSSKQVSIGRNQREETGVSASQKGKEGERGLQTVSSWCSPLLECLHQRRRTAETKGMGIFLGTEFWMSARAANTQS